MSCIIHMHACTESGKGLTTTRVAKKCNDVIVVA